MNGCCRAARKKFRVYLHENATVPGRAKRRTWIAALLGRPKYTQVVHSFETRADELRLGEVLSHLEQERGMSADARERICKCACECHVDGQVVFC